MTLENLCRELKNWFDKERHIGAVTIASGIFYVDGVEVRPKNGQYFRIIGSVFNDGVYQYPQEDSVPDWLTDEEFDGAIWFMAVPDSVLILLTEIQRWTADNAEMLANPFQSESFAGYSYTKGDKAKEFGVDAWKAQFSVQLNRWRKI